MNDLRQRNNHPTGITGEPLKRAFGVVARPNVLVLAAVVITAAVLLTLAERSALTQTDGGTNDMAFTPQADARVQENYPDDNYAKKRLWTDGGPPGDRIDSYLRFEVTGVKSGVKSAKVRLYAYNGTSDGPALYQTSNDWQEDGITWNNKPAIQGSKVDDTQRFADGSWVEYDVSGVVDGDGTYSFVLSGGSWNSARFDSRESVGTEPQLVLTLEPDPVLAQATVETDPLPHTGDAADDPAVWINQTDPSSSTVIGTDKKGGLAVYDLSGKQIQYLPVGYANNVDIRPNTNTDAQFVLGGDKVALVTAGIRDTNTIGIYKVDPETRNLVDVAARAIKPGIQTYGSCMYRSPSTGKLYYFVNSQSGEVEQWELFDNGAGKVDARKVRSFDVGSQTEGCVADDELGYFYIGEEDVGIWKYGAEAGAGTARELVDSTGPTGHLVADVEGLTIAYGTNGRGYLLASSQGSDSYVIYRREGSNKYVKTLKVVAGGGIDGVEGTDGIDVTTAGLGSKFPRGVFVTQDGKNDGGNQNFKLVPYQSIFP